MQSIPPKTLTKVAGCPNNVYAYKNSYDNGQLSYEDDHIIIHDNRPQDWLFFQDSGSRMHPHDMKELPFSNEVVSIEWLGA
jgi:hypothetical protein